VNVAHSTLLALTVQQRAGEAALAMRMGGVGPLDRHPSIENAGFEATLSTPPE
jgi:hypothetical protein